MNGDHRQDVEQVIVFRQEVDRLVRMIDQQADQGKARCDPSRLLPLQPVTDLAIKNLAGLIQQIDFNEAIGQACDQPVPVLTQGR